METKIFFYHLMSCSNYQKVPELNEQVENLFLLTQNRKKENIYILSPQKLSLVSAINFGFCAIPVSHFLTHDDFQLNLVEKYLLTLKYYKDTKSKNSLDFNFLTQGKTVKKQHEDQYSIKSDASFCEREESKQQISSS